MRLSLKLGRWIVGAASLAAASTASAQAPQAITIGLSSNSLGAANYRIANEMGFFKKHGLDAKFIVLESGSAAAAALLSGSVDIIQAGMGELVAAQASGRKAVCILNLYGGTSATLVLAKSVADKLGVSPTAPPNERFKALDGLVIATTTATSSTTVSFSSAAKRTGATFRSVFMAQDAMTAALESGAIQGFAGGAPFWSFPVSKGTGVIWLSGPKGELPADLMTSSSNCVQMMRTYAEANPDLVKRLRGLYADFMKAIDERPNDIKDTIAKLYPTLDRPTVDLLFASESLAWKAKPLTGADVAKEIAFMKESGIRMPGLDTIDPATTVLP